MMLRAVVASFVLLGAACALLSSDAALAESELEKILANPPASGLLIIGFVRNAPASAKGLRRGDLLQKYAGVPLTSVDQLKKVIAQNEKAKERSVEFVRSDKATRLNVEPGPLGVRTARVEKGKWKWRRAAAMTYDPDLSGLSGETWMAYLLSGKHAGFERRALAAAGNGLEANYRVAFSGEGFDDRFRVTVKLVKGVPLHFLSLRYTRETDRGVSVVEAKREGGRLVGTRRGKSESIAASSDTVPSYCVADLAATLPLRIGFIVGFTVFEEDEFGLQPGHELVCITKEQVPVGGKAVEAWVFEDRQYGEPGNRYWIDGKRKLVKAAWESNAASLASTKEAALQGLPAKLVAFSK